MRQKKWSPVSKREMEERLDQVRQAMSGASPSAQLLAELRIARNCVDPEYLQEERTLASQCWIEYAYLSAYQRTELFTREYETQFRRFHGKYFEHSTAQDRLPINPELAGNMPSEIKALWRGRQFADEIGMPYPLFIAQSMESMLNNEGHKKIPRPNQLYSSRPLEHVLEHWNQVRHVQALFGDHWDMRFRAENFVGDLVQLRSVAAIEERVRKAKPYNRALVLANYLVRNPAITEGEARRRFDDDIVDEALREAMPASHQNTKIELAKYRPGCIGMPSELSASQCQNCPVAKICRTLIEKLDKEFTEKCGDRDPKRAKKRADATLRKRKQRARERAA